MAADGTKTMNAKLSVKFDQEMKTDTKKWLYADKDLLKLFPKMLTYSQKVDLNEKKWNDSKLAKAMIPLVRAELQIFANRISDIKKMSEKAKSPKERNKVIEAIKKALKDTNGEISEKCSTALDELESGKGEAKAGLALGKKAMAQIEKLDVESLFSTVLENGMENARIVADYVKDGDEAETKRAMGICNKDIMESIAFLKGEGKQAQNVANYLLSMGKKLKGHENGQLAAFGGRIMKQDVQPELAKLDSDMSKLTKALSDFSDQLKKGKMTETAAKGWQSDFKKMLPMQKTADKAVAAMKSLKSDFKKIEKDLK